MKTPSLARACILPLVLLLSACENVQEQRIPPGYHLDSARTLHSHIQTLKAANWEGSSEINLPGLSASVKDELSLVSEYFRQRYPQLPVTWQSFANAQAHTVFEPHYMQGRLFEPAPPLPPAQAENYRARLEDIQAWRISLKQALDAGDIIPGQDYLSLAGNADAYAAHSGIVQFFQLDERPRSVSGQQPIYGTFAHYLRTDKKPGEKDAEPIEIQALIALRAVYYDAEKRLFYWQAQDNKRYWLYGLAHPQLRLTPPWSGDKKLTISGISARGGQCGESVRDWFESRSLDLPDSGFYHLGYGRVLYDKKLDKPSRLTHPIAFDEKRAKNLIFEPKPPLSDKVLRDYQARLSILGAAQQALWFALDNGKIRPGQDYMGASRGSRDLSHTGIARFYALHERRRGDDGRTVYGVFTHNWNSRKVRNGSLTESALYFDSETGLFYWQNGSPKKMWLYGIAEPVSVEPLQRNLVENKQ